MVWEKRVMARLITMSSSNFCKSNTWPRLDKWCTRKLLPAVKARTANRYQTNKFYAITQSAPIKESVLDLPILRHNSTTWSKSVQCLEIWVSWEITSLSTKLKFQWIPTIPFIACLVVCQTKLQLEWTSFFWSSRRWSTLHQAVRRANKRLDLRCSRRQRRQALGVSLCL